MNEYAAYTSGAVNVEPKICQFDSTKCVMCGPAECTIADFTARRLVNGGPSSGPSASFLELDQLTIFYLLEWFG